MSQGAEGFFDPAAKRSTMELCYFMRTVTPRCVSHRWRIKTNSQLIIKANILQAKNLSSLTQVKQPGCGNYLDRKLGQVSWMSLMPSGSVSLVYVSFDSA